MSIFGKTKTNNEPIYIFLDVDGVLNAKEDWADKFSLRDTCMEAFGELISALAHRYKASYVVISSTWRAGQSVFGEKDAKQYALLKKRLEMVGAVVHGTTPISKKGRQAEIEYYIKRNGIKQYIVLDDDPSLFDDLSRITFYKPDYRSGLTKQDVKRICRELEEHDRRNISK